MMMHILITTICLFGLFSGRSLDKKPCWTDEGLKEDLAENPDIQNGLDKTEEHWKNNPNYGGKDKKNPAARRRLQGLPNPLDIPINMHILKHSTDPYIGYERIISQIRVLNEDFTKINDDVGELLNFDNVAADFDMTFYLNKIIRKDTTTATFPHSGHPMKYDAQDGSASIDPDHVLNFWVCDISDGILGFATFPGSFAASPERDGCVIDTLAFGDRQYDHDSNWQFSTNAYDKGRTATHEIGHWLNLRHIWGDGDCNFDDFVGDTPTDDGPNFGCPAVGKSSCNSEDMWTNFMDYTDDSCMNMFTVGQLDRADDLFISGGVRSAFTEYDTNPTQSQFVNMFYFIINDETCMVGDTKVIVNINTGNSGDNIYLCVSYSRNPVIDVIEDLTVIQSSSSCPADYDKVDTNLNPGNSGTQYNICYKKVTQTDPISTLTILDLTIKSSAVTSDGYNLILTDLNSGSGSDTQIYLALRTSVTSAAYMLVDVDVNGNNLVECQGDCDSDGNCVGNLKCFQRVGNAPNPPGCQGTPKSDWDYCYNPTRAFVDDVHVNGNNLVECQGDCDSDNNCVGNLKCFQRVGDAPNSPGCQGTPAYDWDYCYDPTRAFVGNVNVNGNNLVECQGDCDSDNNCVGNLKCFQRVGDAPNAPGCQGTPKNDWDYCYDITRSFVSDVNVAGNNLVECQGDCDSDSNCVGNLKCFQRVGNNAPNPPGCQGTPTNDWDYCYDPTKASVGNVNVNGNNLVECQGDCDSDSNCIGNLKCFQRDGNAANPPGCQGTPINGWDYCYDPNKSSDLNPLFKRFIDKIDGDYYWYILTAVVVVLVLMNIYYVCRLKKMEANNMYRKVSMEASDTEMDC